MIVKELQSRILFFIVLIVVQINGQIVALNSIKPTILLGAPTDAINGEHVSREFYATVEAGNCAKNDLQSMLHNFLENLQRNLSTSSILNNEASKPKDIKMNGYQLRKLNDLANYFEHSSAVAGKFAEKAEQFFETSKNESHSLLLKLRQVPSAQRFLPTAVKVHLTDYFTEMEFFHILFSEIIDQALEYIVDTLLSIQRIFLRYADIQRDTLRTSNFKANEWCCNTYMEFLQQWSAKVFKCCTSHNLKIAYDVYAITETTTKHIMRQLEFRIQRLYNCFIFGNYEIRCQFLRNSDYDFAKLFAKLDELQQYYDIKIKRGRVTINRSSRRRRRRHHVDSSFYDKCIPDGFPTFQMTSSLKNCFH